MHICQYRIINTESPMRYESKLFQLFVWVKWNEIELISNGNQSKCNEIFCIHTKPKNQELHFGDIESKAVSVEVMSDTEFRLQFAQNIMLANCLAICICVLFVYGTVYGICVFNATFREQAEKLFTILSHITKLKSPFCFNVFFVSTEMNLTTRCLMMDIGLLFSVHSDDIFVT